MHMFKLYVFDLDGTLVDSIWDISASTNYALKELGYPQHEKDAYYRMVGNGVEMLCRRAVPNGGNWQKALELFREHYAVHCCDKTSSYPGIKEMLLKLNDKGALCAVLSNKPHQQTVNVVETVLGKDLFKMVMGKSPRFPVKPDPASLLYIMDELGIQKEETAFVGDSDVDMTLARAAGVFGIGVSWGYRGRSELMQNGAGAVADNAQDILNVRI